MFKTILNKVLARWVPDYGLMMAQQKMFNKLERSCVDFEYRLTAAHNDFKNGVSKEFDALQADLALRVRNDLDRAVTHLQGLNNISDLRSDIVNFELRVDALCAVCGVEVVISMGEVFTSEISEESVARMQAAAAVWELKAETERAKQVAERLRGTLLKLEADLRQRSKTNERKI